MTRRLVAVSLGVATLLIAATTSAQQPRAPAGDRGAIQVGLRFGYGVPFGKAGRRATDLVDDDVSSSIKGEIPIGIDAGYLITPHIYVGLLFQYGFGLVGSAGDPFCNQTGVTCSASDTTVGIGAHFHLNPTASFDPWIGLGVAYEWLDLSTSVAGQSASTTGSGFQYLNVQLGGDISVAPNLAVGPFVSFAAGQYASVSQNNVATGSTSRDIVDKSFHEWLLFGVRGVYNIRL